MPKEASKWDHNRIMRTESSTEANRGIEYPGKPRVAENKQAPRNRTAKKWLIENKLSAQRRDRKTVEVECREEN